MTFGERAARKQEEFGGPDAGGGILAWLWALIAAALLCAAAALGRPALRRRRRPLDRESALRLLEGEHEHERARASARPLSVAIVAPAPRAGAERARLAQEIRRRLPGHDRLGDLDEEGFLVIAPETGERGIAGLAEDLERALASTAPGGSAPRIGTATATDSDTKAQLLERAQPAVRPQVY